MLFFKNFSWDKNIMQMSGDFGNNGSSGGPQHGGFLHGPSQQMGPGNELDQLLTGNGYLILNKIYVKGLLSYYVVRGMAGNAFIVQMAKPHPCKTCDVSLEASPLKLGMKELGNDIIRHLHECKHEGMCSIASVCGGKICFNTSSVGYQFPEKHWFEPTKLSALYPVLKEEYLRCNLMKAHHEAFKISKQIHECTLQHYRNKLACCLKEVEGLKKAIEGSLSYANSVFALNDVIEAKIQKYHQANALIHEGPSKMSAEIAKNPSQKDKIEEKWNKAYDTACHLRRTLLVEMICHHQMVHKIIHQVKDVTDACPIVKVLRHDVSCVIDSESIEKLDKILHFSSQAKKPAKKEKSFFGL
jgi:hypothetical protein